MSDQAPVTGSDDEVRDRARVRAALALRRLGHALVRHDPDAVLLDRVADAAARVADDVEAAPARDRDLVGLKKSIFDPALLATSSGEPISHFDECFVSGSHNPMGIGIQVFREADEAVAHVRLGAAFEGAPGRSHGGIVAAIFDDVLGYLLSFQLVPAFTGELTVRYLAPTPIEQPLEFRGRVVGREGRKILAEGEARADGAVVATARATFIEVDISAFRA